MTHLSVVNANSCCREQASDLSPLLLLILIIFCRVDNLLPVCTTLSVHVCVDMDWDTSGYGGKTLIWAEIISFLSLLEWNLIHVDVAWDPGVHNIIFKLEPGHKKCLIVEWNRCLDVNVCCSSAHRCAAWAAAAVCVQNYKKSVCLCVAVCVCVCVYAPCALTVCSCPTVCRMWFLAFLVSVFGGKCLVNNVLTNCSTKGISRLDVSKPGCTLSFLSFSHCFPLSEVLVIFMEATNQ